MRSHFGIRLALAVVAFLGSSAFGQEEGTEEPIEEPILIGPGTTVYKDADTGFTFAEFINPWNITYRVAVPSNVLPNEFYDTVIQVVAPIDVGWVGMAWGGHMIYNPLTVAWKNGSNIVISSRGAITYYQPDIYNSAEYQILERGTHINETYWQYTARCSGCEAWLDQWGPVLLNSTGKNQLAFAFSTVPPFNPENVASEFEKHDEVGYFVGDFSTAGNADFESLARNTNAS